LESGLIKFSVIFFGSFGNEALFMAFFGIQNFIAAFYELWQGGRVGPLKVFWILQNGKWTF